jgi:hypothetical protein
LQQRLAGRLVSALDHLADLSLQQRQVLVVERLALLGFLGAQLLAPGFKPAQPLSQLADPGAAGRLGHRALLEGAEVAIQRLAGLAQLSVDPIQLLDAPGLLCIQLGEGF